jgi:hypothetical protein
MGKKSSQECFHTSLGFPAYRLLAEKLVSVDHVRDLSRRVQRLPQGFGLEGLLATMRMKLQVDAADAARIPASGAVVVVANHPFGMLDGAMLAALLTRVRSDVKVMTNCLLRDVPELAGTASAWTAFKAAGRRPPADLT